MRKLLTVSLACLTLSACSTATHQEVTSFYDYQLFTPDAQAVSLSRFGKDIQNADIILVGEWHTHSGVHRFQTDLVKALISQGHDVAVSMEQFSRDRQSIINQYLAGEIGEQMLIKSASAWPNYESDYRPLVELAKANQIDVIAANAPKPIVRCIGRQGLDYLEKLTPEQRAYVAETIDVAPSPYKDKFMASMHHGKPEQTEKQFSAQVTWDETMAESMIHYLEQNPSKQIIHLAGKFHIEDGLGTKASILSRKPYLNVVVITPTEDVISDGRDYQLKVLAPPVRYVQMENQIKAYHSLTKRNQDLSCL
ncbi:ChaN family lipoprotein [Vibrio neptunius]|uniref:ChaN family lipoprotein n=1 Tax=Vibrio neptunius TaxID=170651 RepID=A0ABS2ZX48_9VIBR|nr:ChaN family lipoprotein [Vibrio neptunius]MBN3492081.1 ChaN family lipoprotein [Vibrio neptunius]MBN3514578.1 ChaN family lipoprotein [Vibrio neptunius]MBN3549296.1 ChaN family lipoprotein [Vibrio neptunius]MBN3576821.1 ChaN family lipoprotein [Vibrio neptunius]MCH9870485.1 ChaN family lipoprotein [Vibrio neptunius]